MKRFNSGDIVVSFPRKSIDAKPTKISIGIVIEQLNYTHTTDLNRWGYNVFVGGRITKWYIDERYALWQ